MSNVASLELSKELYELSGWSKASFGYWNGDPVPYAEGWEFPAYDLGYLLRNLPKTVEHNLLNMMADHGLWVAMYGNVRRALESKQIQEADTPEDAACKLAIELFKQGILTK